LNIETEKNETNVNPDVIAEKTEDTPKPDQLNRKYAPRRKAVKKQPKNQLQWGD
jgi:hypothetical protein